MSELLKRSGSFEIRANENEKNHCRKANNFESKTD